MAVLFSSFKSILFSYIQLQNWTGILDPTIGEHGITSKQEKATDINRCIVSWYIIIYAFKIVGRNTVHNFPF